MRASQAAFNLAQRRQTQDHNAPLDRASRLSLARDDDFSEEEDEDDIEVNAVTAELPRTL